MSRLPLIGDGKVVHRNHAGHFGRFGRSDSEDRESEFESRGDIRSSEGAAPRPAPDVGRDEQTGMFGRMRRCASQERLGSPLERNDREMSPLGVEVNAEIELDSGLTSDEGLRGSAWGSPRPSVAGFEARNSNRRATSVVNLIRGRASQHQTRRGQPLGSGLSGTGS
jgi:hypothetical protein